jgi:hypothetical protein
MMEGTTSQAVVENGALESVELGRETEVEKGDDVSVEISQDIRVSLQHSFQIVRLHNKTRSHQTDLDDILSHQLEYRGNFAALMSFEGAPTPGLTIEGLGQISLPLYASDAKRIISVSYPAPFGHGEKTVLDKSVRDTWEIEPQKITFANPAWGHWIEYHVLPFLCRSLGLYHDELNPTCELYKLLMYEEGSQCVFDCNRSSDI